MLRLAVYFYGMMLAVAALVTHLWGDWWKWLPQPDSLYRYGSSPSLQAIFTWDMFFRCIEDFVIGVSFGLFIVYLSPILMERLKWGRQLVQDFGELFPSMTWKESAILALLSGLAEEALFRTTLQPMWGWVITSLLFGLVHTGTKKHYLFWTLFALVIGFAFAGFVEWRGGLLLPTTAHFTINFFNLKWIADKCEAEKKKRRGPPSIGLGSGEAGDPGAV